MVWACDAKIGAQCRKEGDGNGSTVYKGEGGEECLSKMLGQKGLSGEEMYKRATCMCTSSYIKVGLR